ncbi:MAG: ScyD/ScyE family protein [Sphingobacteriales bacterium]|nr:MAG: ScyD/ScyE family protein [Sphingobacteriales bacterium]
MRTKISLLVFLGVTLSYVFIGCKKNRDDGDSFCDCNPKNISVVTSVFYDGLNNPRGIKFGPDGKLYVAEGGTGGKESTVGICDQVPEVGPYSGSHTGSRISKISWNGTRTTVADNIPSSQTNAPSGSLVSGVADIAFLDGRLYGITAGSGCSHGVKGTTNDVIKVNSNNSWSILANLSAFQMSHPVMHPNPEDFEPDGTWYSMISVDDDFYAVEPNHGELDKITADGKISRVCDISASQGHIVPTALTYHNGAFYVGNLSTFPASGKSSIYKITKQGQISVVATGFNMILGIAFDKFGGLYVLENTHGKPFPTPGTGDVIRLDPNGTRLTLVSGLNLPTAMTFGPDEKLYISNWGFGPPALGHGQILQVSIRCPKTYPDEK